MKDRVSNRSDFVFAILLCSILGIIFSNYELPDADAGKFSGKSKNKSKSFKKSDSKKSDYKPKKQKDKPKKSDYKPKKSDYKPKKQKDRETKKKIKPNSISQGSSISSFKPANIKNLDKDAIKNLDKKSLGTLDKISTLPFIPGCGNQGNCIDIGGGNDIDIGDIDIGNEINIDWESDWDDIDWDDIDWDDIDIDIDDDIDIDFDDGEIDIEVEDDDDHDDDDVIYINDDDDNENNTYIYNYGYPEVYSDYGQQEKTYQQESMISYNDTSDTTETNSVKSYVYSEIKRIANDGSFKIFLVGQGKHLIPINNSGYVLLGSDQKISELSVSDGSNGQIIILTGADDLYPVKISSANNIDLDQNEVTLGKNDALILIYLDDSKSWVQVASKIA